MPDNFTLNPEDINNAARNVYQVMSEADDAILQAQNAIKNTMGIAGSIPANAKYAGLDRACALAQSYLAIANYLSYGTNVKYTLETLVELALGQDEKTAKEIEIQIEALNFAFLKANTLNELLAYRTSTGDLTDYLEHVKAVWDKEYDPKTVDEEESRKRLLVALSISGYDMRTQIYSKDPVNLGTGNFIYDRKDLEIRGKVGLDFTRFYNAQKRDCGVLGQGWSHSFEEKLIRDQKVWKYIHEDGAEEPFYQAQDGSLHSALTTGNVLTIGQNEMTIQKKNYEILIFGKDGNIKQKKSGVDQITDYIYENGRLCKVENESGCLLFFYDDAGYLTEITDHTQRKVCYEYDETKHLVCATMPDGVCYRYHYDSQGQILSIDNPRNITTVRNEYDEKGRIIRQDFPDGGWMIYRYDHEKRRTELMERNGAKITYLHDELGRHIATTDEAGTVRYTYSKHNMKSSITDRRGNTTKYLYDDKGNLTAVVNALGNKTRFTYNADSKISVVKNALGAKTTYRYDTAGRLMETETAKGEKTEFSYDEKGNRNSILLADGSGIRLEYDERGNIIHIILADESSWSYEYDALNRVTASIDGNKNKTFYRYDERDRITSVTDAKGNIRTYQYNASGKLTKVTDFDGHTISCDYNELNRPIRICDKEGNETAYAYDKMWNLTRVKNPDGGVQQYVYDKLERLIRIILPNGGNICYEYDADGNRTGITDPEGNKTTYEYDVLNRMVKMTDAEGNEMTYGYDKLGNRVWEEDALGNRQTYEYDRNAKLIAMTDYMGNRTEYVRDFLGNVTEIHYPNGGVEKREYNPGGSLKRITGIMGTWEEYSYDGNGNIVEKRNSAGQSSQYTYDYQNHLTQMITPFGGTRSWEYDAMGRMTAMIDENGNRTEYAYSPNGNLICVKDAMGNEACYEYDSMGHLTTIFQKDDQTGIKQKTTYLYDLMGLPKIATDALGYEEAYQYDHNGKLLKKTDRDGYVTEYGYTKTGELSQINYADEKAVRYEYDALHHLAKVQDWNGEIQIENDAMGRAVKVEYPDGKEVAYTYGKGGERTGIIYPDGRNVRYEYDSYLRLTALQDGQERIDYHYDDCGRLVEKNFPNGCNTAYRYNPQGLIESLIHTDREGILDAYSYQYDSMGNRTAIEKQRRGLPEESGFYTYGYDPLGRLSDVKKDGESLHTYRYDAFGNRIYMTQVNSSGESQKTTYTYNAANQLISRMDDVSEETYTYDRRGNLKLIMENGNLKNSYIYGALNRLEQAVNGNGEKADYIYNGLGHRVGKIVGTGNMKQLSMIPESQITYLIDLTKGYHNLLQKEEAGVIQSYLWDGNVAGMRESKNQKDVSQTAFDYMDTEYYFQDELGSPIRLINKEGRQTEAYGYDEFGQDLYGNQGQIQPFGYTGYQSDQLAGTYFAQAREYQAALGRFTGRDIIKGFAEVPYTLNEYGYCWGNPEKYVDRDGQLPTIVIGALVGAAIGGVGSIISDAVSGEDIDLKKAGKNALKGAAAGAIVGTGIGIVAAAGATVAGATAATATTTAATATTVTATQISYYITTAISGSVCGIYNCMSSSDGDDFSNFMNGALCGVTGNTLAYIIPGGKLEIPEILGVSFISQVQLELLNTGNVESFLDELDGDKLKRMVASSLISTIFSITGMKILESNLGKYGPIADMSLAFFDTLFAFSSEGLSGIHQKENKD